MKVLHVWKSDGPRAGAGGAVAMSRLHSGLNKVGIDSRILCEVKASNSSDVHIINPLNKWEKKIKKITSNFGLNDIHRLSSFGLNRYPIYLDSDVVTIHGTHHGFINYLALPYLTRKKPTVFILHDMWALTGHCAYSFDCDRWRFGCGYCPHLDVPPAIKKDNTRLEWKLKKWIYKQSKMTIVSPSRRLAEQAKESILQHFPILHIPHGIDTKLYQPLDSKECRTLLNIPQDKKVLMFAAVNIGEWRKGGDLLLKALLSLPLSLRKELVLLTLGNGGDSISKETDIPSYNLGFVESDQQKAIAYSAADLFVSPTRGEAFGLTVLESMACGTPVVAFGVGGILDLIRPTITGYLAAPEDSQDLSKGIAQLLEDDDLRQSMGQKGLTVVQEEYPISLQIQRYANLYQQLATN